MTSLALSSISFWSRGLGGKKFCIVDDSPQELTGGQCQLQITLLEGLTFQWGAISIKRKWHKTMSTREQGTQKRSFLATRQPIAQTMPVKKLVHRALKEGELQSFKLSILLLLCNPFPFPGVKLHGWRATLPPGRWVETRKISGS